MKRVASLFVILIALSLVNISVLAADTITSSGSCGDNSSWTLSETGELHIYGTGAISDFEYKSTYTYKYTQPWVKNRSDIRTVVIEEGITRIGDYSFHSCDNICSVTIPNTVTEIGDYAFYGCAGVTQIPHSSEFTVIGSYAFAQSGIQVFSWPAGLTTVSDHAFHGCKSLDYVEIPSGIKKIDSYAFADCTSLSDISFPDSITWINTYAFQNCSSLETLDLPQINSIFDYSFSGCSSLKTVYLPDSVTYIRKYAFSGCSSLISIRISPNVTTIEDASFRNCTSLECLSIPEKTTSVGQWAFQNCGYFSSVYIPKKMALINQYAFDGCSIGKLYYSGDDDAWTTLMSRTANYKGNTCISSAPREAKTSLYQISVTPSFGGVVIPSDYYCVQDQQITLHTFADENCTFEHIVLDAAVLDGIVFVASANHSISAVFFSQYDAEDGVIASGQCGQKLRWRLKQDGELFIYGSGDMYDYERKANWGSTSPWYESYSGAIKSVVIDVGVTSIGNAAFANVYYLENVTLPDSIKRIGSDAFYGNYAMTDIIIPKATTSIGDEAFGMCRRLSAIVVAPDNEVFASDADGILYTKDYSELLLCPSGASFSEYAVDNRTEAIADYAFYDSQGCGNVILPFGLITIGKEAFYSADGLTGINLPASVSNIGERALSGCVSLNQINISDNSSSFIVEDGILFNAERTKLICYPSGRDADSYAVPAGVERIASGAFINSSISSVSFPNSLTAIDSYAFEYCFDLEETPFPTSLRFIGHDAFFNCLSLQAIVLPASIETIEYRAFYNLAGDVFLLGDAPTIGNRCFDESATLHYRNNTSGWDEQAVGSYSLQSFSPADILCMTSRYSYSRGEKSGIEVTIIPFDDRMSQNTSVTVLWATYDSTGRMLFVKLNTTVVKPNHNATATFSYPDVNSVSSMKIFALFDDSLAPCCANISSIP